jgi:hypothetical protein
LNLFSQGRKIKNIHLSVIFLVPVLSFSQSGYLIGTSQYTIGTFTSGEALSQANTDDRIALTKKSSITSAKKAA